MKFFCLAAANEGSSLADGIRSRGNQMSSRPWPIVDLRSPPEPGQHPKRNVVQEGATPSLKFQKHVQTTLIDPQERLTEREGRAARIRPHFRAVLFPEG